MGNTSSVKGGVIIDLLKERTLKYGMPVKKGKVSQTRDNYYITVSNKRMLLPVGTVISVNDIKPLVGKEVLAIFSSTMKSQLIAIDPVPLPEKKVVRFKRILCYYPVERLLKPIGDPMRNHLIDEMLGKKIITQVFADSARAMG